MKKLLLAVALIVIAAIGWMAFRMMQPPPEGLDTSTTRLSEKGVYSVSFTPREGEPAVGPIAVWLAEVKTSVGQPVTGAEVLVDGGMPQHGHGLPTSPAAVGEVSPGVYEIDGVKFSMRGWWEFKLTIKAEPGEDTVTFNTVLE